MKPQDDDIEYLFEFIHYMTKYRDDGIDFKFYHENYVEITDGIIEAATNNPKINGDELNELKRLKGYKVPQSPHGEVVKEIDNDMLERLYQRMLKDTPRPEKDFIKQQIKILKKFPKEIKDKFEHKYFALLQLFENKKNALETKGAIIQPPHTIKPEAIATAPPKALGDQQQLIKDKLTPLAGKWKTGIEIMKIREFENLVTYCDYLLKEKKLPESMNLINTPALNSEKTFISYTLHQLWVATGGGKNEKELFIDLMGSVFVLFTKRKKSTNSSHFSDVYRNYQKTIDELPV